MKLQFLRLRPAAVGWIAILVAVTAGAVWRAAWIPPAQRWIRNVIAERRESAQQSGGDHLDDRRTDSGHGHAHSAAESLELSDQALRNLGLTDEYIRPVELTTFRRGITVPALVTERPGRTRVKVATPMTGVVMHVHAIEGEAVDPGTLLFQIRLTHEDLVQAQTEFLRTLGDLDVEQREIERLTRVTQTGAVSRIKLLEREYARDKLESLLKAQREALRLHGLSVSQVESIAEKRQLLRELQVFAPAPDQHSDDELQLVGQVIRPVTWQSVEASDTRTTDVAPLVISTLNVHKGQSVAAGETLCELSDYSELHIEGLAFEQDAPSIAAAAARRWTVTAVLDHPGSQQETLPDLEIVRISNEVDAESRTLPFYVSLPNTVENVTETADGHRFVSWRYRPGQRLQLRIPVEEWRDQIVLPVEAVTREGAEFYVFQQNGSQFDRVAVHVKHRDQNSVVIASDGALFPGDVVALRGAHQMQMALRNRSGGATDPHAGHTH